jgi:hypothetical protein
MEDAVAVPKTFRFFKTQREVWSRGRLQRLFLPDRWRIGGEIEIKIKIKNQGWAPAARQSRPFRRPLGRKSRGGVDVAVALFFVAVEEEVDDPVGDQGDGNADDA